MNILLGICALLCLAGMEEDNNKNGFAIGFFVCIAGIIVLRIWG